MTTEELNKEMIGMDLHLIDPELYTHLLNALKERDEFALLIFQPCGESHHNANKCPYCQENKEKL